MAIRDRDPDGRRIEGFEFGNSPAQVRHADLSGRILVHRTGAGTQGLLAVGQARALLTGSFVNATATARYLHDLAGDEISLVAMGWNGVEPALEDQRCA